jgi:hypothetical protein
MINSTINKNRNIYNKFDYNISNNIKKGILEKILRNNALYKISPNNIESSLKSIINTELTVNNKEILYKWLKRSNQNNNLKLYSNMKASILKKRSEIQNKRYNSNNNSYLPKTANSIENFTKKIFESKSKNILNIFNDGEIENIMSHEDPIKKMFSLYKQKFKIKENIPNYEALTKMIRHIDQRTRNNYMRNITLKREITRNANKQNNVRQKRKVLELARKQKRRKPENKIVEQKQKNLVQGLKERNKSVRLIMNDKEYNEFIQLIYNDMVHDQTLGENPNIKFKNNVIPVLVKKKQSVVQNFNINLEAKTKQAANSNSDTDLKTRLLELKGQNTLVIARRARNNRHTIQFKQNSSMKKMDVVFDSDFNNILKSQLFTSSSNFRELLTLGGLLDAGRNVCGTSFYALKESMIEKGNRMITDKYSIDTSPLYFSIETDKYQTVFEINYDCSNNTPIQLKLNGKPIKVVARSTAVSGNTNYAIGKMCGDLLQILSVIRNNHKRYRTCFVTYDKGAANIFLFLSQIYANKIKSEVRNAIKKINYKNLNETKNITPNIEDKLNKTMNTYYKPKLIWIQQGGQKQSQDLRVLLWFVNLKNYISSFHHEASKRLLNSWRNVTDVRVPNSASINTIGLPTSPETVGMSIRRPK